MTRSVNYALAAALLVSTAACAYAADMAAGETAQQKNADQDFGKLSKDGRNSLRDIRLARLDIFDGHIDRAKADIAKATTSLGRAQSDETVFTKAESELKPPAGMNTKSATAGQASTTPVEWLPVDGAMTLGEDYVATPDKTSGVAKANDKLAKGDRKGAMDELKIANVDVNFLVELAPLKATLAGVKQASSQNRRRQVLRGEPVPEDGGGRHALR